MRLNERLNVWSVMTSRLYLRIWLAVVVAVAVITLGVGWAWRLSTDVLPPIREIQVRNEAGELIGTARTRPDRRYGQGLEFDVVTADGRTLDIQLPRTPRPRSSYWWRPPFGFFWTLSLVGLAVALGSFPIIRRLTLRLESLQRGVERWGSGDLSTRVPVQGRDEVAFLAERFNRAAERIETLIETQNALLLSHKTLLANASHELRSPLARIRMGLELMGGDTSSTQRKEISRSINELDQLIDEILLASRLDARQADVEPFEALDLTGLAAEECARVHAELTAELDGGSQADAHTLTVNGSPRLLRRLVRNLLENARRYSNGDITLALSRHGEGTAQTATIRVSDRGPGVPPDQRERIFEPFYRLPGASEHAGGVGLGLALVKSIAERHGGTVRCEDNPAHPGGGASFVVDLPVHPANGGALPQHSERAPSNSKGSPGTTTA